MIETMVDVSRWQGNIDEDVMLSRNPLAMVIRLGSINSSGVPYSDYLVYENASKFGGDIPLGFYWYFRPEQSGQVQAEFAAKVLNEIHTDFGVVSHLPIFVDVESNDKHVSFGRFVLEITAFVYKLSDFGYSPGVYTRGYFWNDNLGNLESMSHLPLWVARYSSTATHPWDGNPVSYLRPLPWADWVYWQWSADGNGLGEYYGCDSDSIDLNRLNFDSVAAFYKSIRWNQEPVTESRICHFVRLIRDVCENYLQENCQ